MEGCSFTGNNPGAKPIYTIISLDTRHVRKLTDNQIQPMRDKQEHIYQLLLRKREGTITESEDRYVMQQIHSEEDVELMWSALQQSPSLPGEERFIRDINAEYAWRQVEERLTQGRKVAHVSRGWLAVAAVLSLAILGISYFWKTGAWRKPAAPVVQAAPVAPSSLSLQMADGQTIALPYNEAGQRITTDHVQLTAGKKQLVYTASARAGAGLNTLTVPPKMDYRVTLSDGTSVWLNATSRLRFPFNFENGKREVYLEGEGFFEVAKNTAPFVVHTPHTSITVLGTSFNVNAYGSEATSTSLVSGKVLASAGADKIELRPGQEAVFSENKGFNVREFDKDEVLAWMKGMYVFHNTSLDDIALVVERWFGVKVVLDDPSLAEKIFTGALDKQQTLEYFLETLQIIGQVDHYYEGKVVHLKPYAR